MAVPASIIPELEDAIQHGSPERRALMLQQITALFIDGAEDFSEDLIDLFDDVLSRLSTAQLSDVSFAALVGQAHADFV